MTAYSPVSTLWPPWPPSSFVIWTGRRSRIVAPSMLLVSQYLDVLSNPLKFLWPSLDKLVSKHGKSVIFKLQTWKCHIQHLSISISSVSLANLSCHQFRSKSNKNLDVCMQPNHLLTTSLGRTKTTTATTAPQQSPVLHKRPGFVPLTGSGTTAG